VNKNVMKRDKSISFNYKEFDKPEDLDPADLELLTKAREIALNAYAPYSGFLVGAALRLESGKIVSGTNVENAAFPSGICAERNAISNASANHPGDKPLALAIAAFSGEHHSAEPVSPCGNCRQVIAEEEFRNRSNIRIILGGKNKIRIIESGSDLLPLQFNSESFKVNPR
jgi:cytidine deaminase